MNKLSQPSYMATKATRVHRLHLQLVLEIIDVKRSKEE